MFRFPSSYALMIVVYGLKPFAKGIIHALLYEEWVAQIWSLLGVELLSTIVVCVFEFRNDNHRSKVVFMADIMYSGCFVILNLLLLLKHGYFDHDQELVALTEEVITTILLTSIGLFGFKFCWEFLPLDSIKQKLQGVKVHEKDENEGNEDGSKKDEKE